jgi:hypothetical protein
VRAQLAAVACHAAVASCCILRCPEAELTADGWTLADVLALGDWSVV